MLNGYIRQLKVVGNYSAFDRGYYVEQKCGMHAFNTCRMCLQIEADGCLSN